MPIFPNDLAAAAAAALAAGNSNTDDGANSVGGDPDGRKTYIPGHTRSGDVSERTNMLLEEQNQDLHHEQIETLGSYLSNLTSGLTKTADQAGPDHPGYGGVEFTNVYYPNPGSEQTTLKDESGDPVKIVTAGPDNAASKFIDNLSGKVEVGSYGNSEVYPPRNESQVGSLDRYSNSGMFDGTDAPGSLADFLDKRTQTQGHHLLTSVQKIPAASPGSTTEDAAANANLPPAQRKISAVLKHNRFSPGPQTPFIVDGEFSRSEFGTFQKILGTYNPNATDVDREGMARVGVSLGLASTGHGELDPHSDMTTYAAMLPSMVQLALKNVNVDDLRPKNAHMGAFQIPIPGLGDALGSIPGMGGGGGSATMEDEAKKDNMSRVFNLSGQSAQGVSKNGKWENTSNNNQSYGQLNSAKEPFGGALPEGTIMVAATGLITMIAGTFALEMIFMWMDSTPDANHQAANPTTLRKGYWHKPDFMDGVMRMMGIPKLHSPFFDCLSRGIQVFYGFDSDIKSISAKEILSAGLNLIMAPGYYASILRNVVRDVEQIMDAFNDFPPVPTPSSIVNIMVAISTSATFRFMCTMATVGQVALNSEGLPNISPAGKPVDFINENPGTRIAKSRIGLGSSWEGAKKEGQPNDKRLVWRHSALPSRYLLPESFHIATNNWGMPAGLGNNFVGIIKKKTVEFGITADNDTGKADDPIMGTTDGRLSKEYVEFIENELEMEYVPFYFHDLRTNEIVAFHAFLDSVENSFSPEWQSSSGYGRMDDVMVYTKTTREVSVSFFLAATSPDDFDALWWDINKLTTLIYPQWSGGKQVKSGGESWIQPFSQIPTASPIIRLRVGDLVKTNYSRFNLARLFGLGENDNAKADGKFHVDPSGKSIPHVKPDKQKEYNKKKTDHLTNVAKGTGEPGSGYSKGWTAFMLPGTRHQFTAGTGESLKGDAKRNKNIKRRRYTNPNNWKVKIIEAHLNPADKGDSTALGKNHFYDGKASNDYTKTNCWYEVAIMIDEAGFPKWVEEDMSFAVNYDELTPDPKNTNAHVPPPVPEAETLSDAEVKGAVQKFFHPDNNAVVRSFERSMSRGLAGAITSFSMDHADAPWETGKLGSRAPMWVKMAITMKVIHDIPPGLDKDGFNRAPIFNVGDSTNAISGDARFGTNFASPDDELVKKFNALRAELASPPVDKE